MEHLGEIQVYQCGFCEFASNSHIIVMGHMETEHSTCEQDQENTPEVHNNNTCSSEWDEGDTHLLLEKYQEYISQVGPMKKFKRKKDMWSKISKDIAMELNIQRTPLQVENRYKTVLKRKKAAVVNNSRSGASRISVPYEEELGQIAALDDSIEPEVMLDATRRVHNTKKMGEEPSTSGTRKDVKAILLQIHHEKEEARERRHQEKLQVIRDLIAVLKE